MSHKDPNTIWSGADASVGYTIKAAAKAVDDADRAVREAKAAADLAKEAADPGSQHAKIVEDIASDALESSILMGLTSFELFEQSARTLKALKIGGDPPPERDAPPALSYMMTDHTNSSRYLGRLGTQSLVWIDHFVWSAWNLVCLVLFWICAAILFVWRCTAKVIAVVRYIPQADRLCCKLSERLFPCEDGGQLSFANAETPDIHRRYELHTTGIDLEDTKFNLDNALFFISLSALVYEDEEVLAKFLEKWHLEYKAIVDFEAQRAAWVIYHSYNCCQPGLCKRKEQNFIVVVFKGTSPFDLLEWLIDFVMTKIKPHGEILPGMIHEGFYNQFEWPVYQRPIRDYKPNPDRETREQPKADAGFYCPSPEIERRLMKNVFWERESSFITEEESFIPTLTFYEKLIRRINWVVKSRFLDHRVNPALWISGHSLGGALASLFFAHLLYVPIFPLIVPREQLKGGYSFGAPSTGDSRYANEINRLLGLDPDHKDDRESKYRFFDVINANDLVSWFPLGSQNRFRWFNRDGRSLTNFSHFGVQVLLNHWPGWNRFGWHGYEVDKRRSLFSVAANLALHYPSLLLRLWTSKAKLLTLLLFIPYALAPPMFDHYPSEYIRHLRNCKSAAC